jgi:3-isopropylmalate/(R)-2-methylmalate dehydratase small subunit
VAAGSGAQVKVDLEHQTLTLPDGTTTAFHVDAFPKRCMMLGVDELGYLMQFEKEITAYETRNPAVVDTRKKM